MKVLSMDQSLDRRAVKPLCTAPKGLRKNTAASQRPPLKCALLLTCFPDNTSRAASHTGYSPSNSRKDARRKAAYAEPKGSIDHLDVFAAPQFCVLLVCRCNTALACRMLVAGRRSKPWSRGWAWSSTLDIRQVRKLQNSCPECFCNSYTRCHWRCSVVEATLA